MTSFCEGENTSPGSTQSHSDKRCHQLAALPAALVGRGKLVGGRGSVALNKSLKGTLQHLMRKKAPSLPLRSAVNYRETCAVTPSSQWILIKPSGHLFIAEQEVPVFVRVCWTKLWLCTEDSIFMTLLLILYVLCRYPPPFFFFYLFSLF